MATGFVFQRRRRTQRPGLKNMQFTKESTAVVIYTGDDYTPLKFRREDEIESSTKGKYSYDTLCLNHKVSTIRILFLKIMKTSTQNLRHPS